MMQQRVVEVAGAAVSVMRMDGYKLDYSMQSLDRIDAALERYRQEGETSDSMPAGMTMLGMYVGEVIRRHLGRGEWVEDAEGYCTLHVGNVVANPIGKCGKRLDNGHVDSVKAFAEATVLIVNMPDTDEPARLKAGVESQLNEVTLDVSEVAPDER